MAQLRIRLGTIDDSHAVFEVLLDSLLDFGEHKGVMAVTGGRSADPAELWARRRPLWEHLARTADQFWVAEQEKKVVGYARSILRDGVRELTEFFVRPDFQSGGLGRDLLSRAFPASGARMRVIIATSDLSAMALYLRIGLAALVPQMYFSRRIEIVEQPGDLEIVPMTGGSAALEQLAELDRRVLGHRRDVDHAWLGEQRYGYFYQRSSRLVGYGYISRDWSGPFCLLEPSDFPAVLAHAQNQAAELSADSIGFEVPLVNQSAVVYLLSHGYRLDGFLGSIMSDLPFGKFENYILTSPPFIL